MPSMPLLMLSFLLSYVKLLLLLLLLFSLLLLRLLSLGESGFDDIKAATSYSGADRSIFNSSGNMVKGVIPDAATSRAMSGKANASIERLKSVLEAALRAAVVSISLLVLAGCGAGATTCADAGTGPGVADFRDRSDALLAAVERLPDRCEGP